MSYLDDINQRKAAVLAGLQASLPSTRIVRGEYRTFKQHTPDELLKGVVMLMSSGELEYRNDYGLTAADPRHRFLIVAHLNVPAGQSAEQLETAEGALIEEIKAFWRAGLTGMAFEPVSSVVSRQQSFPLGWVVCTFDAVPPKDNFD